VSSDFENLLLSYLMGFAFGLHNREHVEVSGLLFQALIQFIVPCMFYIVCIFWGFS
jgi:hypothetical protein